MQCTVWMRESGIGLEIILYLLQHLNDSLSRSCCKDPKVIELGTSKRVDLRHQVPRNHKERGFAAYRRLAQRLFAPL
jgi:hypothetical protein